MGTALGVSPAAVTNSSSHALVIRSTTSISSSSLVIIRDGRWQQQYHGNTTTWAPEMARWAPPKQVHEHHNIDYCQGTPQLQCLGSTTQEFGYITLGYGRYNLDTGLVSRKPTPKIWSPQQRVTVAAPWHCCQGNKHHNPGHRPDLQSKLCKPFQYKKYKLTIKQVVYI